MGASYDPTTARMADRNILLHMLQTGEAVLELFGIRSRPILAEAVAPTPTEQRIAELTEAVRRQRGNETGGPPQTP